MVGSTGKHIEDRISVVENRMSAVLAMILPQTKSR